MKFIKTEIEYLKESNAFNTVCVLIINNDNNVLILKRGPTAPWHPNEWSLVGGGVDNGETFIEAVLRETFEETSLKLDKLDIVKFDYIEDIKESYNLIVYTCNKFSGTIELDYENTDYKWVNELNYDKYVYIPHVKKLIEKYYEIYKN